MEGVDPAGKRPIRGLIKTYTNMVNKTEKGSTGRTFLESQWVTEWLSGVGKKKKTQVTYFLSNWIDGVVTN